MPAFFAAKTKLREAQLEYKMLSDNKSTVKKLDNIDRSYARNNAFARKALGMPEYFADFTPGTKNVNVPVLIISGTADHNVGPDHYKLFKFPHQQVKIIKGGHILYYEKNKEFAAAVKEFIKK
jgi:proline iminopeptidase